MNDTVYIKHIGSTKGSKFNLMLYCNLPLMSNEVVIRVDPRTEEIIITRANLNSRVCKKPAPHTRLGYCVGVTLDVVIEEGYYPIVENTLDLLVVKYNRD